MRDFFTTLLHCSISMALITLAYAAMQPLLAKRYSARWLYTVWLVIVAGWVFPFRPQIDLPIPPMQTPDVLLSPLQPITSAIASISASADMTSIPVTTPLMWMLEMAWILGIVTFLAYHLLRHRRFVKLLRRWSEPVTDSKRLATLHSLKSELGIKAKTRLYICQSITSPTLVGFFRPTIYLPTISLSDHELYLILKHELIHLKRNDLWSKALILGATAIHWFNPIVYLMGKATAIQCEISCDALVLKNANFLQRKQYGQTIICVVRNGATLQTALSTNFYGGKKGMKNRLISIMETKRKKTGVVILFVTLAGIITTGAALATHAADNNVANMMELSDNESGLTTTSIDGGETWINKKEYNKMPASDIVWWTYNEYKEWLDQEKVALPNMIGSKAGYYDENGVLHEEIITQKWVDEAISQYEQILDSINKGTLVAKSVHGNDSEGISIMLTNPTDTAHTEGFILNRADSTSVSYNAAITLINGTTIDLGSYATKGERFTVIKAFCIEQVKTGEMTQQEADEILSEYK